MQINKGGFTVIFLFIFFHLGSAQDKFNVTINLPSQLEPSSFEIYYENGKKYQQTDSITSHSINISDSFFTKFVGIDVYYKEDKSLRLHPFQKFFVQRKSACITFFLDSHGNFSANNVKLKNAINALDLGKKEMDQFTFYEREKYTNLINSDKLYDSLVTVNEYGRNLAMKQFEFIKRYPNHYYSLWSFRTVVAPSGNFNADSVASEFKNIFDIGVQNSIDGKIIRQIISGRSSTRTGDAFSAITVEDIDRNRFTIGDQCNEYKLLVFWGTWCAPCIAELPIIKEIGDKYGSNGLKIFGFAISDKLDKVKKTQEKFNINWHIVLNDENVPDLLGITGTPETILIDNNGKIVYRSDESGDNNQLIILQEYLRKHL